MTGKWFLFLAAAALPLPVHAAPAARQCTPMRVMSYNIRLALDSDGPNRWAARRDFFIGQIALMQPQLIGLQEVVDTQRQDLIRGLPDYRFVGVGRDDGRHGGEHALLGFDRRRFTLAASGNFWLSPTPSVPSKGWDAAYRRVATWARLVERDGGRSYLVLNTHLDNVGEVARREGAQEIRRFLATHRRPGEAAIVTGDFNSEPGSPAVRILVGGPPRLIDTRSSTVSPPLGPEGTFNNFAALPRTTSRIDYVLVDPIFRVERSAVLAWHGPGGRVASDHFPILADIRDRRCGG